MNEIGNTRTQDRINSSSFGHQNVRPSSVNGDLQTTRNISGVAFSRNAAQENPEWKNSFSHHFRQRIRARRRTRLSQDRSGLNYRRRSHSKIRGGRTQGERRVHL